MNPPLSTYHTLSEILGQPEAWEDALHELERKQSMLQAFFAQTRPEHVIFLGCGSPYFLARAAASTARQVTGLLSEAHPGSDLWLFSEQTLSGDRSGAMVVISRSGETTEVLRAVETYRAQRGQSVIAITCYGESQLARQVPMTLLASGAKEIGLAQTRSFTSMYVLAQGLVHTLAAKPLSPRFRTLPSLGRALIERYHDWAMAFGGRLDQRFKRVFFLGGGSYYGLACEAMLKMKEMSLSQSEAYQVMEFRHGPMSMVTPDTLIVGFVSESAQSSESQVLAEMKQRGATVLALTPTQLADEIADEQVLLPRELTDLERGTLYLPILHLIFYYHTLAKGLNPDLPNNLTAVIHLDDHHANKGQFAKQGV
jgi:glucosamine--fructose-6-phosphate aminotransferase (isomerizing)